MVDRCRLLGLARSTMYYEGQGTSGEELELLRRLDELHMKWPFYGSRNLAWAMSQDGHPINRKHVQRLMRVLGIESLAPKPSVSKPAKQHKVYPYLLRSLTVERACQVWATDITYIPLENGGFVTWSPSSIGTRGKCFRGDYRTRWIRRFASMHFRRPSTNLVAPKFSTRTKGRNLRLRHSRQCCSTRGRQNIDGDGKGRCLDNVFVERLWRSLKYEDVYLRRYCLMPEAALGIGQYLNFFNSERPPHHSFQFQTPDSVFEQSMRKTPKIAA